VTISGMGSISECQIFLVYIVSYPVVDKRAKPLTINWMYTRLTQSFTYRFLRYIKFKIERVYIRKAN
jgi:hypothetical protein